MKAELLQSLLDQWRALSLAEAQGIGTGNWAQVSGSQQAKHQLQEQILRAARGLGLEAQGGGTPPAGLAASWRQLVGELIALEERNLALVTRQLREARRQREALERSRQALRRMHLAYGTQPAQCWTGYC